MFSPKRDETRPGYEMRKEHIAIGVMILLCLPILAIYVTFFAQAFVADGKLSLSNFRFLYTTIVMGQYTVTRSRACALRAETFCRSCS